jgi:hypothetical protein
MGAVHLALDEHGADAERLDQLTRLLAEELRQLDVQDVSRTTGPAPAGTRALDAVTLNTLVVTLNTLAVTLLGSGGLTALVTAARAWLGRGQQSPRSVRLEVDGDVLELSGASDAEQDRLVSLFLSRHPAGGTTWAAGAEP